MYPCKEKWGSSILDRHISGTEEKSVLLHVYLSTFILLVYVCVCVGIMSLISLFICRTKGGGDVCMSL